MRNPRSTLIIARPGQLRDSLQVLLAAIPQLGVVNQADDGPTGLALTTIECPTLVFLGFDLPKHELLKTLKQAKIKWPRTPSIALVDNPHDDQAAKTAGADIVLMKGVLAAKLSTMIEDLLKNGTHKWKLVRALAR